jgi:hypothetical protein
MERPKFVRRKNSIIATGTAIYRIKVDLKSLDK